MQGKRRILPLVASIVMLLVVAAAPASARTGPRLPTGPADWATFSAAEKQAAYNYELSLFNPRTATISHVGGSAASTPAPSGQVVALTVTWTASCGFGVSNAIAGTYVRSDAVTDANQQVSAIYAHSEFYRDGSFLAGPNDDETNRSHAEAISGWNFSYTWEHPTYRVKSWHNIEVGTVWQSQRFCDFSWTKP